VPQLPTKLARQRFFRVVTNAEHPEVAELLRKTMTRLGWREDKEGPEVVNLHPDEESEHCRVMQTHTSANMCHMWDLLWTWTSRIRVPEGDLFAWQRVNHFQECRWVVI
jgi:hypothetical protein